MLCGFSQTTIRILEDRGKWSMNKQILMQYVMNYIKTIPKSSWENSNHKTDLGAAVLAGAGDKELKEYIVKYGLVNPDILARFIVKMQIEQITATYEGFYSLRRDYKNEWKSMLESAGDQFEYAMNNPQKRENELDSARQKVMECIRVFKNNILEYINEIRKIDNQSRSKFLFTSIFSLKKSKENTALAIETLKMLMDAYKLLALISSKSHDNISSLVKNFEEIRREVISGDNCLLMANYCKEETDKKFWYELIDLWDKQKEFFSESMEIFGNENEVEYPFWDNEMDDVNLNGIF